MEEKIDGNPEVKDNKAQWKKNSFIEENHSKKFLDIQTG